MTENELLTKSLDTQKENILSLESQVTQLKLEAQHATKVRALETQRDEARKSTTDIQQRINAADMELMNELEGKERQIVSLTRKVTQLEQAASIKEQVDIESFE